MRTISFDLGDFNSQSAWHLTDDVSGVIERGQSLTTSDSLQSLLGSLQPDRVLCEACAMACLLADVVQETVPEASFLAANTNAEAWRWTNTKRKTDASDAERLSRLDRLGELEPVALPTGSMRAVRRMLAHRHKLIGKRTACYNAIRHACKQHEVILPRAEAAWSDEGLQQLEARSAPCAANDVVPIDWETTWLLELHQLVKQVRLLNQQLAAVDRSLAQWRRKDQGETVKRLQSAPGIGPVLATALLAFIGDPHRFQRGKQVAAYAGLVPRVFQSGARCRHGRITKSGNPLLRRLLINAAWQAIRHDAWAKDIFERVSGGSKKRRKQAAVAVARHLLIRCWAMMRDQQSWRTAEPAAVTAA
jgi:transposase